jgi:hypothetical protein
MGVGIIWLGYGPLGGIWSQRQNPQELDQWPYKTGHSKEVPSMSQNLTLTTHGICWCLDLALPSLRTVRNKYFCFSPRLWSYVMQSTLRPPSMPTGQLTKFNSTPCKPQCHHICPCSSMPFQTSTRCSSTGFPWVLLVEAEWRGWGRRAEVRQESRVTLSHNQWRRKVKEVCGEGSCHPHHLSGLLHL